MSRQPPQQDTRPMLRPLGVGEILDVTFRLYRENFLPLVKIAAVGVVPTQILSLFLLLSAVPDSDLVTQRTDPFGNTTSVDVNEGDLWRLLAATLATVILGLVANLIVSAAITKGVAHNYVDGQKPNVGESLRAAMRVLLPLIGMTILFLLGVAAGTILCVLPGIFLYVSWSVASPALIMERAGPAGALGRSLKLVRPRWWPTFGLLLLVGIMTWIAQQIISTPISLIAGGGGGMFGTVSSSSDFASLFVGSTISEIIAGLITTPFAAIVIVVLYVDLRVRHEGFDVEVLARSIGATLPALAPRQAPPPPPAPPIPPPAPPQQQWGMRPPGDQPPQ